MAPSRPSLSITLPSNFEFHYSDGQLPKTPDRQQDEPQSVVDPPPPPRPHFKIKRRRAAIPEFDGTDTLPDTVIPTIEMSEAVSEMSSPMLQPANIAGLLAPFPAISRLVTPPKTPAARVNPSFDSPVESPANEWALIHGSSRATSRPSLERSASVSSSFSDSSVSSCGSSDFSAPHAGSCTSPESEAADPFMEDDARAMDKVMLSPDDQSSGLPEAKRVKTHRHIKWTPAMDEHLWMTYMQYLSDPRVTPFKMLPGTAPPLGVCSRVASKARRTWSHHRSGTPSIDAVMAVDRMQRGGSPDTIRPEVKSVKQPQWPRSDSATRRRLRTLCKRKPSLSAHYQRLLHTRSPSPFQSSSSASHTSEPPQSSFSGRDMSVSLVAATAQSMQPDGHLAQLASGDVPPRPQSQRPSRTADWFARIPRSQAHQKSLSLQSGLSLDITPGPRTSLADSFDEIPCRTQLLQSMSTTKSLGRTEFKSSKAPSLDSPVELQGVPTLPRSLKRRFKADEEKSRRRAIQDVFGPSGEDVGGSRNRGFTVGALHATDNLAELSSTPSCEDLVMTEASEVNPEPANLGPTGSRSVPRRLAEPVPRLGSPFTETPNSHFNTFPRSYVPSLTNPQPFQQRLKELVGERSANPLR